MLHSYRISKFDPAESETERRDDWTSISDVGRRFGGAVLSRSAYEAVESKYVEVLRLGLAEAEISNLHVTDLVRSSIAPSDGRGLTDGTTVGAREALAICRAQLRGEVSCHLFADSDFTVEVGFDLYLYVASPVPLPAMVERATRLGLFVEADVPPPYLNE